MGFGMRGEASFFKVFYQRDLAVDARFNLRNPFLYIGELLLQ
jgi:hypothetical protein